VCKVFDVPLELDTAYLETLETRFAKLGRGPMPSANRSQAEIPRGATTLPNHRGTALGLLLEGVPGIAVLLPGVPEEMRSLLEAEVVPRLRNLIRTSETPDTVTRSRTLRTTGVSESRLADDVAGVEPLLGAVQLSFLPGVDGVDLRVTIRDVSDAEATCVLDEAEKALRPLLGGRFYGLAPLTLAEVLIDRMRDAQIRLATAESCTGGIVSARITSVPGASDVFAGGVICYENASKVRDLGVPAGILEESGAVSEPVARAMVEGVCERFQADAGIAVTGVAGPGGGTETKPVGTVWLAARLGTETRAVKRLYLGKRSEVQQRSAQGALDLVRNLLETY
jgi:nicotinamide-nucleotide amidase